MLYLNSFTLPDECVEDDFVQSERRTCFNTFYPFLFFQETGLEEIEFEPVTIFYGGNGTGKSTLLNIIAEKLQLNRNAVFNKTNFFDDYVSFCETETVNPIPNESRIITSDDVFDYILDIRNLNNGIHNKRDELFDEYRDNKYSDFKFRTMEDYDTLKKVVHARSTSMSKYVKKQLAANVREYSNGESAFKFFTEKIKENALYLLDEPENSLSPKRQLELRKYIEDSTRFYNCQFIISTHSPFLLSMKHIKIYNLDKRPVETSKWTELENVRTYFDFFEKHRNEFD
ncbi:MAG: AAA family ATPase [Ruminococcus sp.]|nr:AAA family ATPase [Ruminococcus sp.]